MGAIRDLVDRKRRGELRGVIVAGCLTQLYRPELEADPALGEVDGFLGLTDASRIVEVVRAIERAQRPRPHGGDARPADAPRAIPNDTTRLLTGPRSFAYLRISEGCDHDCAFCIIPTIRGKHRSKPLPECAKRRRRWWIRGCVRSCWWRRIRLGSGGMSPGRCASPTRSARSPTCRAFVGFARCTRIRTASPTD